jgi:hypothetical protein
MTPPRRRLHTDLPDDLIVVVAPGTRVRYLHSRAVAPGNGFIMDATALALPPHIPMSDITTALVNLGVPIHDADEYA